MEQSLKYFALITIVLAGATGKFLNGPWIINKITEYSHPHLRVPGKALSPVIFGDFYFCTIASKFKFINQCRIIVIFILFSFQCQATVAAKWKLV